MGTIMDETGTALGPLIGWGLTVLAIVGGVILRDRQVMQTIKDGDDRLRDALGDGEEKLHDRVSKIKDEYVRRDDLASLVQRIEKTVDEMRGEMREQRRVNERLDTTLTTHTAMLQTMMAMLKVGGQQPGQ